MGLENIDTDDLVTAYVAASQLLNPVGLPWTSQRPLIIAGGYIRDMYLEKTPKDIDVFTTAPMMDGYTYRLPNKGEEYDNITGFEYVGDVTISLPNLPLPVNFVHLSTDGMPLTTKNLIGGFDITMCQIGFDGDALEMTPAFMTDVRDKIMRVQNQTVGANGHVQRMLEKFPDWKYIPYEADMF